VLNFWFIGCPACSYETPKLNAFAAKFAGNPNIEFIAMTYDPAHAVKKYLTSNPFNYKIIADADPQLKLFAVGGYPKNIIIGKDGRIVYWRSPIYAWDKFESVVRAELEK
jgi:thiol-disulfide isomerase/thioredoxin